MPFVLVEPEKTDTVQVKAYLPRELKRQAFAAMALQEINFSQWVREHLEQWLQAQQGA